MQSIIRHTCLLHLSNTQSTMSDSAEGTYLQETNGYIFLCNVI